MANPAHVFENAVLAERVATRFAKAPTFQEAKTKLMDHLQKEGWKLSDRGMKVPHATSPDGELRIWFKTQAIWFSSGNSHTLQHARSVHTDIRNMPPEKVVEQVQRFAK